MKLIWKRPDGFHDADPADYQVADLGARARLWLHKNNQDQYPFRIAGGWEERESSIRLNNLVNLANASAESWVEKLKHDYDHSMSDDKERYLGGLLDWLSELEAAAKGDTWEVEILQQAMKFIKTRVQSVKDQFLKA